MPPITKSAASKKKAAVEENLPEKTEKEVEQNNAEKGNENKIIKEKKSDSLNVKSKSKSQRPRSFIDDDNNGLFGDDQDDLFTAPSKVFLLKLPHLHQKCKICMLEILFSRLIMVSNNKYLKPITKNQTISKRDINSDFDKKLVNVQHLAYSILACCLDFCLHFT